MAIKAFHLPHSFEVRFTDQPGGCERPHTHSSLLISAVSKGNISLQVNEDTITMNRGIISTIGPNILHCVHSYSKDFSGIYVLDVFELPVSCKKFNKAHIQVFKSMITRDIKSYLNYILLCEKLLANKIDTEKTELLSKWLYTHLSSYFSLYIKISNNYHILADKIRNLLDENRGESAPFEKIAAICGCSKEHCNRIFRKSYNISMQAYFLNQKAEKARMMLTSNDSLSEIALLCGFYDQSHFSRIFKDIFQISPAKYRSIIS